MQVGDIEKLKHVAPNTPLNGQRPFRDDRFSRMWCPFHNARLVGLLVYVSEWGEVQVTCEDGCLWAQQRIEAILAEKTPQVFQYTTFSGATAFEAHWSLGAR